MALDYSREKQLKFYVEYVQNSHELVSIRTNTTYATQRVIREYCQSAVICFSVHCWKLPTTKAHLSDYDLFQEYGMLYT